MRQWTQRVELQLSDLTVRCERLERRLYGTENRGESGAAQSTDDTVIFDRQSPSRGSLILPDEEQPWNTDASRTLVLEHEPRNAEGDIDYRPGSTAGSAVSIEDIQRDALRNAEARIRAGMRNHFSEATIGGVVNLVWGKDQGGF